MSRPAKIVLGVVLLAIVLVAGLIVALPSIVNVDAVGAKVVDRIQVALGRRVTVGQIHLSLFPPSLVVEKLAIGEDPKFGKGQFKNNRIPLTPQHMFGVFTDFGFAKTWHWRWDVRYVGDRYRLNDEANTLDPLKPYVLVDTRLSYAYRNIEIFGGIDNLFAQQYYAFGGKGTNSTNRNYYPAPQRSLTVGAKVKF